MNRAQGFRHPFRPRVGFPGTELGTGDGSKTIFTTSCFLITNATMDYHTQLYPQSNAKICTGDMEIIPHDRKSFVKQKICILIDFLRM